MSLLRNSAWAATAAVTLAVSRFMLAAILAHRLAQGVFGQYAYGQWLVDLSFLLCSLGVTSAASRYMAEYRHDAGLLLAFIRRWRPLAIGLPFLASGGVLIGAWLSGMKLAPFGLLTLATWSLANGFWAMQTAALVGLQRFDLIFRANLIAATIMLIGALFLPLGKDPARVFGLMAFACFSGSIIGLLAISGLTRSKTFFSKSVDWRQICGYAINMWLSALIASLTWSRGEFPLVKAFLGDTAVAHYAAALAIYGAAVQAIMLGVGGVSPHLMSLWGQDKKKEAIALGRSITDLQLALSGLGSLVVIIFGTRIVSLAFSEAYQDAARPLSILCFGLISFVVSSQSVLLQLETNAKFNRNTVILGLIILYTLALALIPHYGLDGAAIARIGAMLSVGTVTVLFVLRRWGSDAISLANIAIVVGVLSAALFVQRELSLTSFWIQLVMLTFGASLLVTFLRDTHGSPVVRKLLYRLARRTT
jgi:O-antigen/teichoic acid export membrane protein